MAVDLKQFKGLTPYAAELFGIYQPLLGWKSRRKRRWIAREQAKGRRAAVDSISRLAPTRAVLAANPKPLGPTDLMSHAIEDWADSETGRALQAAAIEFVARSKRMPDANDWKAITRSRRLRASAGAARAPLHHAAARDRAATHGARLGAAEGSGRRRCPAASVGSGACHAAPGLEARPGGLAARSGHHRSAVCLRPDHRTKGTATNHIDYNDARVFGRSLAIPKGFDPKL